MPYRGALEKSLTREGEEVRFLIYKSGDQFELKIIFFIDQLETKVLGEITLVSSVNTPIKVQIVQGDLTQENTDAIVNPTDQFG